MGTNASSAYSHWWYVFSSPLELQGLMTFSALCCFGCLFQLSQSLYLSLTLHLPHLFPCPVPLTLFPSHLADPLYSKPPPKM